MAATAGPGPSTRTHHLSVFIKKFELGGCSNGSLYSLLPGSRAARFAFSARRSFDCSSARLLFRWTLPRRFRSGDLPWFPSIGWTFCFGVIGWTFIARPSVDNNGESGVHKRPLRSSQASYLSLSSVSLRYEILFLSLSLCIHSI